MIGKAEQVGMCREQAQEAERRHQKTGMDRDGEGRVRSSQQWSRRLHELREVGRDGHCLPRSSAACMSR